MTRTRNPFPILAVALALVAAPAAGQSLSVQQERQAEVDALLAELAQPELPTWQAVESKIFSVWEKSGSDTVDLLLQRGQEAIEAEEVDKAVEHFSAAIDHAPDFAEAYHGRASAYFQMEEFGLALSDLEHTLLLNPAHFGAMTGMGVVLEQLGEHQLALDILRIAQEINPHREAITESIERLEHQLGEARL
jgi:tetratricopeptide (TPR) repeat protein